MSFSLHSSTENFGGGRRSSSFGSNSSSSIKVSVKSLIGLMSRKVSAAPPRGTTGRTPAGRRSDPAAPGPRRGWRTSSAHGWRSYELTSSVSYDQEGGRGSSHRDSGCWARGARQRWMLPGATCRGSTRLHAAGGPRGLSAPNGSSSSSAEGTHTTLSRSRFAAVRRPTLPPVGRRRWLILGGLGIVVALVAAVVAFEVLADDASDDGDIRLEAIDASLRDRPVRRPRPPRRGRVAGPRPPRRAAPRLGAGRGAGGHRRRRRRARPLRRSKSSSRRTRPPRRSAAGSGPRAGSASRTARPASAPTARRRGHGPRPAAARPPRLADRGA